MGAVGHNMVLRSQRIVTPSGLLAGEVAIHNGRITAISAAHGTPESGAVELGERWLVPGYIDTHVHGGGGAQCNTADPDEVAAVARFHARHGTTALLATTVAAPVKELEKALEAIARCSDSAPRQGATVLGAHLEGPFLNTARPGAMDPSTFIAPDPQSIERLLVAGNGTVRMMTLAPELPGGLELVNTLAACGVIPSLGHSDASYTEAYAAVRAGVRAATHLFNAMPPFHHREPGVLGAALDLPDVSCELICDGAHVDPVAIRLVYRVKGAAKVRLMTDAMEAAGMPDGHYRLGAAAVEVRDGVVRVADGGSIAGSTLTMDTALRNAVRFLQIPLFEAVALASTNPARLLGIDNCKGTIAPGMDADLVVLDEELMCCGTLVNGEWMYGPSERSAE